MSTTRDHGDYVFQCDGGCGATLESETSNFESARNILRRHRWKPYRQPGEIDWQHRCPSCEASRAGAPQRGNHGKATR